MSIVCTYMCIYVFATGRWIYCLSFIDTLVDVAQELFDNLPTRDVVSRTSLILGYVEHGAGEEALNYFLVADGAS